MALDTAIPPRRHFPYMNDNRTGGLLLVAGNVAGLITMALHPHAHRDATPSPHDLAMLAHLDRAVHGLALVGIVLIFLGALALTRRLAAGSRAALAALVLYGLAVAAILVAGTLDGFVAADLLDHMPAAGPKLDFWWSLLDYNTRIVMAFASVYTVAASVAIFLWSLAIVRTRRLAPGLGWYGLVLAPLIVLVLLSGHIRMDAHGFGLILLTQAVWFIVAGILLARSDDMAIVSSPV